ncbi:IDEAL domain-containing protein [Amphibacillus marinus]|uniref:IDEAL domain-containing protein n=1 Tax=Amphibacillus marinus TaxID=872970 RepID=A0A1H8GRF5_9BACI|nr:IDEAL domain-containing protein [Amphibacillus marinus]SEN46622.1 IDEAL domain-containing protein [Amphibacillus marinus]
MNKDVEVKIGDWVKLQSSKGERIHGYIEKEMNGEKVMQLRVVTSDNHLLAGHSIQVQAYKLEREKRFSRYTLGELEQLIDLSLLTRDRAWFDALTAQYSYLQNEIDQDRHFDYTSTSNRI